MSIKVPEQVLKNTTKCRHEFSCLDPDKCYRKKMCEVDQIDGKNVLLLKDKNTKDCPYRLSFGNGQICVCPTHYAISCMKN